MKTEFMCVLQSKVDIAAQNGHVEVVQLLLSRTANLSLRLSLTFLQ